METRMDREFMYSQDAVGAEYPRPEHVRIDRAQIQPREPIVVDRLLRRKGRMLITGPSKAGKSFAAIELAVAVASGTKWMDEFRCTQGRVLYLNMELDEAEFFNRVYDLLEALGLTTWECVEENFEVFNLSGRCSSMAQLKTLLYNTIKPGDYDMIILDPIYVVYDGSENDAKDAKAFVAEIDSIRDYFNCSFVYVHHHAKGDKTGVSTIDRGAGSGVFARHADCILDMISPAKTKKTLWLNVFQYNATLGRNENNLALPFELSATLRALPNIGRMYIWFDFPRHYKDELGILDEGAKEDREDRSPDAILSEIEDCALELLAENGALTIQQLANAVGRARNTVAKYVATSNILSVVKVGGVNRIVKES